MYGFVACGLWGDEVFELWVVGGLPCGVGHWAEVCEVDGGGDLGEGVWHVVDVDI